MITIQELLKNTYEENITNLNFFTIEEKKYLINELFNIFENHQYEASSKYLDLFFLLKPEEDYIKEILKNTKEANHFLNYVLLLNIAENIDVNKRMTFVILYAKHIDISEDNYVLLFKETLCSVLSNQHINRNILNKNFTEEQKKEIIKNFNLWCFHEKTKYTVEEKKIFIEKIGFLPFLLYHHFEKDNTDNEYMISLIVKNWNQILEMEEDYHNLIQYEYEQKKETKPKRFYLVHLSPNDFMFMCFLKTENKVKTLEEMDIDSYLKLCSLDKRFHKNMMDCEYLYYYPELANILDERLNNYLLLENF